MSELQQRAIHMIRGLSDENISILIGVIDQLVPREDGGRTAEKKGEPWSAFERLDAARAEIRQYLPEDFDPEKELEEARAERYGRIDRYECCD